VRNAWCATDKREMEAIAKQMELQLKVSGYVSEVVCGELPLPCKQAFTRHLLNTRNTAELPSWMTRHCPNYVGPQEINDLWYHREDVMHHLFREKGYPWAGYRRVSQFFHFQGFGSGKEGLGLFEMSLEREGTVLAEFVPFEPAMESPHPLFPMSRLKQQRLDPPEIPSPGDDAVAVSSGSWAKGTIAYNLDGSSDFRAEELQILVIDLSPLGIGEDHFVAGFTYAGRELKGTIIRETEREMHQVVWYSAERRKWLAMYESGERS
jgi:hypothetical protein